MNIVLDLSVGAGVAAGAAAISFMTGVLAFIFKYWPPKDMDLASRLSHLEKNDVSQDSDIAYMKTLMTEIKNSVSEGFRVAHSRMDEILGRLSK